MAGLTAELLAATRLLAAWSAQVPRADQAAVWRKTVTELTTRRDELEADLARASAGFRRQRERETLTPAALRRALPRGTALIDFFVYTNGTPDRTAASGWTREDRLVAFVVRPDREVARVEVGPAKTIADAVATWRQEVRQSGGPAAAVLRRTLWNPVAAHVDGVETVLVSPTGSSPGCRSVPCRAAARARTWSRN